METTCQIRLAVAADIERIVTLDRATESLPHWPAAEYRVSLQPTTATPPTHGTHRCLFIAERASELVGFAVGKVTAIEIQGATELRAELESIAVANSVRRSGIGRALCRAVIEWSIQRGATAMDLEVRSRSEGPIALYRQLGFIAIGLRAKYYRDPADDAIQMRAHLPRLEPEPNQTDEVVT